MLVYQRVPLPRKKNSQIAVQMCDLFSEAGEELGSNHPAADCQKTQVIGLQNNHNLGHRCWQNMAMSQNECTAKNEKLAIFWVYCYTICGGVCETFHNISTSAPLCSVISSIRIPLCNPDSTVQHVFCTGRTSMAAAVRPATSKVTAGAVRWSFQWTWRVD